jgi:hypothetical protein
MSVANILKDYRTFVFGIKQSKKSPEDDGTMFL